RAPRTLKTKEVGIPVRPGDVFFVESAGGGGWGPRAKRRREARAADAENGFVRRRARGCRPARRRARPRAQQPLLAAPRHPGHGESGVRGRRGTDDAGPERDLPRGGARPRHPCGGHAAAARPHRRLRRGARDRRRRRPRRRRPRDLPHPAVARKGGVGMRRAALVLLALLAPAAAHAEMRLPPGFSAEVYVTGSGEAPDGRAAVGIPSTTSLAFDAAGMLYTARSGRRYRGGEIED